jgi:hypothetical protein
MRIISQGDEVAKEGPKVLRAWLDGLDADSNAVITRQMERRWLDIAELAKG